MHDFDEKTRDLGKQLLHHKIKKTLGKKKLILFIEYLEKFTTNTSYANIWELLLSQWFTLQEIETCEQVVYADKELSQQIEIKIDEILRDKK